MKETTRRHIGAVGLGLSILMGSGCAKPESTSHTFSCNNFPATVDLQEGVPHTIRVKKRKGVIGVKKVGEKVAIDNGNEGKVITEFSQSERAPTLSIAKGVKVLIDPINNGRQIAVHVKCKE